MARKKKISRESQYPAANHEAQLERERRRKFLGSAKVPIEVLGFHQAPKRRQDDQDSERLLRSFEIAGCLRLGDKYHVQAVIDQDALSDAVEKVGASTAALLSKEADHWPRLQFPDGFRIQCLHGQHRIEAGSEYLWKSDRWWVVDFYSTDISPELRVSLSMQTSNEQALSAGEIYFHILRCDERTDAEMIDWWWAQIQSVNEREELQKLFTKTNLNAAFRKLALMPALAPGMRAGMVGRLLRLKIDENAIRYLTHIHDSWLYVLDHNLDHLHKVNHQTLKQVEGRNPANSLSDRELLKSLAQTGAIFGSFSLSERNRILRNLQGFPRRIPSLYLFFKDFKYLEGLVSCQKRLISPLRHRTVLQSLNHSFVGRRGENHAIGSAAQFDLAYRKLYLFIMRNLEDLRPGSVLLEKGERRQAREQDARAWYDLALEAHRLGFRSDQITTLKSQNPDQIEARHALLRARNPMNFVYDESDLEACVNEMLELFAKAKRIDDTDEPICLVRNGSGEGIERRFGWPWRRAHTESAKHLYLENMHCPDPSHQGELTPFFIRRDVYLNFFGHLEQALGDSNTGSGPPQTPLASLSLPSRSQTPTGPSSALILRRPSASRNQNDAMEFELAGSPIPSSRYSAPPQDANPIANPGHDGDLSEPQDPRSPRALVVQQDYREATLIQFILLTGVERSVVEEIVVIEGADPVVEQVAGRYASRGFGLFDTSFRSLAPSQCLRATLMDSNQTVLLIPPKELHETLIVQRPNRKRKAVDELSGRPRKFLTTP